MNKIKELISPIWSFPNSDENIYASVVIDVMKEYAEHYARKCLKLAAEEAEMIQLGEQSFILTNSITDIKLPEHE